MATPFCFVLLLFATIALQAPNTRAMLQAGVPVPPGHRAANDATRQAEKVEPPLAPHTTVSATEIQQQADELLALAQQVHTSTQRASQGLLDKNLKDKLKRIEKLSRKLRDELDL